MEEGKKNADQTHRSDEEYERHTLYVGGLSSKTDSTKLRDFISERNFSVVNAKLRISNKDFSNTFGIVKFCSEAEAQKALDTLNGAELDGRKMDISWFRTNELPKDNENASIYAKFTSTSSPATSITDEDLLTCFGSYGKVIAAKVLTKSSQDSCDGFVQFETSETASRAIKDTHGTDWNGHKLFVTEYKRQSDTSQRRYQNHNLYCKNFPQTYSDDDLKTLFGKYGEITSLMCRENKDGKKQAFI